jgi:beta-1,4-mannosyl-glycoprotein beta-1,4-N-acetylglucosaminyltransferase
MIIDLCYFFDECDMLELRLKTLDKYVDKFILIDANVTFGGDPHTPLHPKKMERFAKWKDKIEYYVVDDFPNDKDLMEITLKNSNGSNNKP